MSVKHDHTPENMRRMIAESGLSQRGMARAIGISDRAIRGYCKDGRFPFYVQLACMWVVDNKP